MKNRSLILEWHTKFADPSFYNQFTNELKAKLEFNKKNYNSIINFVPLRTEPYDPNNLLVNIPYSLKDNFSTKGIKTTGGSLLLEDFIPPYDSTAAKLLKETKAQLVSKDCLDEFGLGGTGLYCAYGRVINPYDKNRITGGSSSGTNVNVTTGLVAFGLGTDTGDSVRFPASFLNNVGYKPSYGLISRFGVYPYSPSLDHVGIICKYVTDAAIVLDVLAKRDDQDFTSIEIAHQHYFKDLQQLDLKKAKIAYIKNCTKFMYADAKQAWDQYIDYLSQHANLQIVDFDETYLKALLPVYRAISYSEAVTSLARLDGITFGKKVIGTDYYDTIMKTRSKYLGNQIKERFVCGSYFLNGTNMENIFEKAKKIRRLVKEKVEQIFKEYDCILFPGAGSFALTDEQLNTTGNTLCDDMLLLGNFTGCPSITIPAIKQNPNFLGVNITGKLFHDQEVLNIAYSLEAINEQYQSEGGKN